MTRSVPGGQRGSSKDPAERSALWGNNSATFHHFIVISLYRAQLRTDEAHEGKSTAERGEEGGVYRGARGGWSFKQGEVWTMEFKKGITKQWSHPHLWDKQKTNWSDKGHNRTEKNEQKTNSCWEDHRKAFDTGDTWAPLLIWKIHLLDGAGALLEQKAMFSLGDVGGFHHHLRWPVILIRSEAHMSVVFQPTPQ